MGRSRRIRARRQRRERRHPYYFVVSVAIGPMIWWLPSTQAGV